jgi:hypothetical protein
MRKLDFIFIIIVCRSSAEKVAEILEALHKEDAKARPVFDEDGILIEV